MRWGMRHELSPKNATYAQGYAPRNCIKKQTFLLWGMRWGYAPRKKIIKAEPKIELNEELLDELIGLLEKSDSFNYTKILINNHFERAINNLDLFPDSNAKLLLENVAEYATTRKL